MRSIALSVVTVLALAVMAAPAAAQERHSCGNYGFPEGSDRDQPVFTFEPIVGAGVENIRTRAITCRTGRRMVKAFWHDGFDCSRSGLRCTYRTYRCANRRLGEELWLMRCFDSRDRDRMLKFRFGA